MKSPLILNPRTCALVIVECQNAVVGAESVLPALAEQVGPMLSSIAKLAVQARSTGALVVHATFELLRGPRRASPGPSPLLQNILQHNAHWTHGSQAVQPAPEVGVGPDDLVIPRSQGLIPSHGTELLPILRSYGIDTVVVSGVSLNIAIPGVAVDAVNEGFRVVVPTDGVAGTPPDYAQMVLKHSIAMIGRLATSEQIATAWREYAEPPHA